MTQKIDTDDTSINCEELRHPEQEVFIRADSHFECGDCGAEWHFDEPEGNVQIDEDGEIVGSED